MESTPWLGPDRPQWLAEVTAWIGDTLADAGMPSAVQIESVKERSWGAVLRVVTTERTLYFKSPSHVTRHEPVIISALSTRWPALVPELLAADLARSWMLLADNGSPMNEVLDIAEQITVIERLLPAYAEMQASTTDLLDTWLDVGTPDRRVDRVPDLLELLLTGATSVGALSIDDAERAAYLELLPLLARVCDELGSTPVADALDHADLHGTNVLVDRNGARLIDWGDACITHPFSSLFVPFQLVVAGLPVHDQGPTARRLRDTYLEAWGSGDRQAFAHAVWIAHVTRAIAIAHETFGEAVDQAEITSLLHSWYEKRTMLADVDGILRPI